MADAIKSVRPDLSNFYASLSDEHGPAAQGCFVPTAASEWRPAIANDFRIVWVTPPVICRAIRARASGTMRGQSEQSQRYSRRSDALHPAAARYARTGQSQRNGPTCFTFGSVYSMAFRARLARSNAAQWEAHIRRHNRKRSDGAVAVLHSPASAIAAVAT